MDYYNSDFNSSQTVFFDKFSLLLKPSETAYNIRHMYQINVLKTNSREWKVLNELEFKKEFNQDDARVFLERIIECFNQLKEKSSGCGIPFILQLFFSELNVLGKFYGGNLSEGYSLGDMVKFIREYLGKKQGKEAYVKLSGLLVDMFFHGSAHIPLIKSIKFKMGEKIELVGWHVTDKEENREKHLTVEWNPRVKKNKKNLYISVNQLIDDTIIAVELYRGDLGNKRIFSKFKKCYFALAVSFYDKQEKAKKSRRGKENRNNYIYVKNYSREGIRYIKELIYKKSIQLNLPFE